MAESLGEAILELRTDQRKYDSGLRAAERKAKDAGKKMTRYLTIPIAALGAAAGRSAAIFDDNMNKVISLTALGRTEVEGMVDQILRIGPAVGKSPEELSRALFPIASAGNNASQSLDILTASAMASTAGFGTTEQAATALNKVMASFSGEVDSAAEAMGILVATASEADALPDSLAQPMARFIPFARAAGIELRVAAAEFALITRGAGSAEEASTAMVGAINAITKPAENMRDVIAKAGLPLAKLKQILAEEGVLGAVHALENALGAGSQEFEDFFMNIRGGLGVNILLNQQMKEVERTMNSLATSGVASLIDAFQEASKSPMFRFRQGMAALNAGMIVLGNAVLPIVLPLVRQLTDWIVRASRAFAALSPRTQKVILSIAGLIAVAGPVILTLTVLSKGFIMLGVVVGKIVLNVVNAIAWMARGIAAGMIRMVAFLFSVPGAIAVGIGILVGLFFGFRKSVVALMEEVGRAIVGFIKTAWNNVIGWVRQKIDEFINLNIELINKIREFFGKDPLELIKVREFEADKFVNQFNLGRVKEIFRQEVQDIKNGVVNTVSKLVDTLKEYVPEGIMDVLFPGGLDQTTIDLEALLNKLGELPGAITDLGEEGDNLADKFEDVGKSISSSIASATTDAITNLRSLGDFAKSIFNIILQQFVQTFIGQPIGDFFGSLFQGFGGGFAEGGRPPMGKVSIVGENGPEPFIPDRPGTILPNSAFAGMGTRQQIQMNFTAGLSSEHLALVQNVAAEVAADTSIQQIRRALGRV